MPQESAGILMFRRHSGTIEVLLVHFGGPYWLNKDAGAWAIPKGLIEPGEAPEAAALREFQEELGTRPRGKPRPLARIRQKGGKWVEAFVLEGDFDVATVRSNHFTLEWPPGSGRMCSYPEVDEARWFTLIEAFEMILPSQRPLLDALVDMEKGGSPEGAAALPGS
ncbi:NUDIX domain-containing protein [Allosphingosinicella sp.]|jgi:predicted NUDIX family NTP pyrophosphohydrolase|uniref:NUDIX domain-containing protein n=1 Tax=Allosphingosinicella sp. TaxID=2823234 RepID=UPI002F0BBE40